MPVSLEHIILKCTEKSPDRRYQNVTELIADLKQSLLTPDVNFVKEVVPDGAKTVAITRDEISKIKRETGRIPQDEDNAESRYAYLDHMNDDDEDDEEDYDDEDYDDDEDYEDEDYDPDDEDGGDDEEDDDDEDGGILDPKLEKIMMIGGIAAAVIIVIIVIVILVQVFGGRKTSSDSQENDTEIEDVLEESVEVPDLRGKSYAEAKEELNALGLGIDVGETRSSDEYEAGQIISQSVDAGTEVDAHTTIVVDICGDGSQVEIPDLEGKSQTQAESSLSALGLSVDISEVYSDEVAEGRVISTSPAAGQKVEKGSLVQVQISKGREADAKVTVPNLQNRDEATAKQLLSSAGLSSGSATTAASDTVAAGNIISQNPAAGTQVEKGSSVSYVVSSGPSEVYIGTSARPGNSESSVTSYLQGKGLVVNIIRDYNDSYGEGIVYDVQPGDGSTVKPGSTVNVYVSQGPEPVQTAQVPNLTGMTVDQAKNALGSNFSLKVTPGKEQAPNYSQNGLIYWQRYSGTQNIGTTIEVYTYANTPICTDVGKSHTAPAGTGEGVTTTCTVCGTTFTTPVSAAPSGGTGSDNSEGQTSGT